MNYIGSGIGEALKLIVSFDQEMYRIILLSFYVSLGSTLISSIIAIPCGFLLGLKNYKYKKVIGRFLNTFMSLPPVVVGLMVAIIISRKGPLGELNLLFTPLAMIIAQTILVTPIIMGNIFNNAKERGKIIQEICKTLGGNRWDTLVLLIREMKNDLLVGIATGFGRAISEVGAVMIVGGNIKNHTRVMTSFIAMNQSMGNYGTSIAMGMILLILSFLINTLIYNYVTGE